MDAVFVALGGRREGLAAKTQVELSPDAFFEAPFSFMLEVDELQHFTPYKAQALLAYPPASRVGFDMAEYLALCDEHSEEALRHGAPGYHRPTKDFPFPNGRDAQRAYLDAFRDLLPPEHALHPTLRIPVLRASVPEPEVEQRLEAYLCRWGDAHT